MYSRTLSLLVTTLIAGAGISRAGVLDIHVILSGHTSHRDTRRTGAGTVMSTTPAIGPSTSSDRPNMPRITTHGIMVMGTIASGTPMETAIIMMTIEPLFRPSTKVTRQ